MFSPPRLSHSTRAIESILLCTLALHVLVVHRAEVGHLPLVLLAATAILSSRRGSLATKSRCSRLRKCGDAVGLACGAALPLSLLPSLPGDARVFATAAAVTSLVCAAYGTVNAFTTQLASALCASVALAHVDGAPLGALHVLFAAAVPLLQRKLIFRCASCFTVAEGALVAACMCGALSLALHEVTSLDSVRCDTDHAAALHGMTVAALLGAVLSAVVGIGDCLKFPVVGARRRLLVVGFGVVLPTYLFAFAFGAWCEPLSWTARHVLDSRARMMAMVGWATVAVGTVCGMSVANAEGGAQVVQRKAYHVAALCIFVGGVWVDASLTAFAAAVGLAALMLMEMGRICGVERVEQFVHAIGGKLVDEKDRGRVKVTHVYLLAGCAAPLWSVALGRGGGTGARAVGGVSGAGVVTVCVMDSVAAAVGRRVGRTRWGRGAARSLEGSAAGVAAGVVFARVWGVVDGWQGGAMWARAVVACCVAGVLEGTTAQIDNLVLPLAYWAVLGGFRRRLA